MMPDSLQHIAHPAVPPATEEPAVTSAHVAEAETAAALHHETEPSEPRREVRREAPADSTVRDSACADSTAVGTLRPVPAVSKPAVKAAPPAWMSGLEPQPRAGDSARDPAVAGIFLLLFLIMALGLRHSRRLFAMLWRDLTSTRSREKGFDERTAADKRLIAVFYIQLVAFMAMLSQSLLRVSGLDPSPEWSPALTLSLTGLWALYYAVVQGIYRMVGYTFAPSAEASLQWVRGFNSSQVLCGFALGLPAICAVFWPEYSEPALYTAGAVYLAARVTFIAKGLRIFYTNLFSLVYFFSYLCALEIVPMVIVCRCALLIAAATAA